MHICDSITEGGLKTGAFSPTDPTLRVRMKHRTPVPDPLDTELLAITYVIKMMAELDEINQMTPWTDSLAAVKQLKWVAKTLEVSQEVHAPTKAIQ